MKKNTMMRLASFLLIAVLITTSTISGTYAKYVTQDSASDSARVAKWGVTVLASGSLFGENYFDENGGNGISADVMYSADTSTSGDAQINDIVAPGTNNAEGMKLAVSGTPEVKNTIEVSKKADVFEEIFLKAGTYATLVKTDKVTADNFDEYGPLFTVDGTTYTLESKANYDKNTQYYEVHDVVTIAADYYPVTYIWTPSSGSKTETTDIETMYNAISTYFNATTNANTAIDKSGVITWKWDFERGDNDDEKAMYNGADTILGNLIAKANDQVVVKYVAPTNGTPASASAVNDGNEYNLTTNFDVTITITQVD